MLNSCFHIALVAAVIGYVYAEVLIKPGELLSFWWVFLERMFTYDVHTTKEVELPEEVALLKGRTTETIRSTEKRTWLLLKPLGGCSKCVAGQLSLWAYLYLFHHQYSFTIFIHLIFTICLTILITLALKKALLRL